MIQMRVGKKYRVEYEIGRRRRSVQRVRFLATLKLTAIDKNSSLSCFDDVTRTGYFAASCSNEGNCHSDGDL